ncbi:MAG TPA: hypothetical protein VG328_22200 [Stellaceae bacterium]|nr:hypothetical protein [Stellaceae bacterium]
MADPSREPGAPAQAPSGRAGVWLRAGRPPRPANDNRFPRLKQLARLTPLLVAIALLAWALIHAFRAF